jgi:hypothetical protein
MSNPPQLPAEIQRALCDINRHVFRLGDGGGWIAIDTPSGEIILGNNEVAELLRLGYIEVTSGSVIVPTLSGRRIYRDCAASGHARHR